ncbi:hypothetical protein ACJ72_05845 [Emergomyces africanus]|uniref:Uncharacterized protein n=1 Tax=Emergomyces africanus TaxID=1955775 RepID=A0A1B7NSR1_9EURO|nr:hypothetical protein ACJ72_05845 [Emergomyces africanus]
MYVQVTDMIERENNLVWNHGSFNVCIPENINNPGRTIFPCENGIQGAFAFIEIGEETFPCNAEEQVWSEAATYIWIGESCTDIPISKLLEFGVPGSLIFMVVLVMQLTNLYMSNLFLDKGWNIKYVIDLEWVCSLSRENLLPPFRPTDKGVDQINGPEYD